MFYYVLRYALIGLVFGSFGWTNVVLGYLLYDWFGAAYIFVNFAVSHTHKDVLEADKHIDWVRYSSNHTVNIDGSWWCNWLMSYLNFQIEHHLFPSMPQFRHPKVSIRVRALFKKHNLHYDCRSYLDAMVATFKNLHEVGTNSE